MKLLLLTLGTLLILALLWMTLFFWGQGLQYQPYDHPLMKTSQTRNVLATESLQQAEKFLKQDAEGGLLLSVRMSRDGLFFTAPASSLQVLAELSRSEPELARGPKPHLYDFSFLQARLQGFAPLDQWMTLKPEPKLWIFDLQDNALEIDRRFADWFEKQKLSERALIRSDIDLVVSSLKEMRPLWIYGSSLSDLNKFLTLGSIGLQGIANFQRDYYFTPLTRFERNMINENVLKEVRKRHKKIALGPVRTDLEKEQALRFKPDLIILLDSAADKNAVSP
ncbi:MAG: hypothetical protein ACK5Y2_06985 [Bdellovibrionales bacterium]